MRLSVIGCGYLGAVHAAAMASIGHEVVGIDVDVRKIDALSQGERARSSSRVCAEILTRGHRVRAPALHDRHGRRPPARRCTSSASARRSRRTATRPTSPT